jgi:hypothetical protein
MPPHLNPPRRGEEINRIPLSLRDCVVIHFCVISKRSEKSDLQKQVILSEAKDLPVQERSLTRFGTTELVNENETPPLRI